MIPVVLFCARGLYHKEKSLSQPMCRKSLLLYMHSLFVLLIIIIKQLVDRLMSIAADRRKGTAPCVLSLAKAFLYSFLVLLHELYIISGQRFGEIKDPLGSLLNAPETILRDSFLSLSLCLLIHSIITAAIVHIS